MNNLMEKKEYIAPEFESIGYSIMDSICSSSPEATEATEATGIPEEEDPEFG